MNRLLKNAALILAIQLSAAASAASAPLKISPLRPGDIAQEACGTYYMEGARRPDQAGPLVFVTQDQKIVARVDGELRTASIREMQPTLANNPSLTPGDRLRFWFGEENGKLQGAIDASVLDAITDDAGAYALVLLNADVTLGAGGGRSATRRLKGYDLCL